MTASSKQVSRWGSLLQQAVAGVESRLDNILADGTDEPSTSVVVGKFTSVSSSGTPPQQEIPVSRGASTINKPNDTLQERLARAVAIRNVGVNREAIPSNTPSSLNNPVEVVEESFIGKSAGLDSTESIGDDSSYDRPTRITSSLTNKVEVKDVCTQKLAVLNSNPTPDPKLDSDVSSDYQRRTSEDLLGTSYPKQQNDLPASPLYTLVSDPSPPQKLNAFADYEDLVEKLQSKISASETQRLEDAHRYIEKIDALQCKLQYLARESADLARMTSGTASSGSLEKKLADKELQVALLLEEGQSLSKKELNNLATIKKLKNQLKEGEKEAIVVKKKLEAANKDVICAAECRKKMQDYEKQISEQKKIITQLHEDHQSIKSENETKNSIIANMKANLEESTIRESKADSERICEFLKVEKKRVADLENYVSKVELEKNLEVSRAQSQIKELKEKLDANEEHARISSLEMKTEQQILESKLEAMTAKAEEVSSGSAGDAQARLLRQIETLQSQYSVSNENWRRIEASLVGRAIDAEKERDEMIRKENDTRRKARDAKLKAKNIEEKFDDLQARVSAYQNELSDYKCKLETVQKRADKAETELRETRIAIEYEKKALKLEEHNRLAEEKQKWLEEIIGSDSINYSRGESPLLPFPKSIGCEYTGLQNDPSRRTSTRSVTQEPAPAPNLFNNRTSNQLFRRPSCLGTLSRKASKTSFKEDVEFGNLYSDHDEFENGIQLTSPFNNVNEMASGSFAGAAGPSVQLVERMSSTIRRLECEKLTMKEDIARLSNLRNEARAEIVCMIKQLEAKKDVDKRFKELEKELSETKERYETTLLMLGEKSEEVDELKGDVQDIKSMYRDLVERTVV